MEPRAGVEPKNNPERSEHSQGRNQQKAGQIQGLGQENRTDPDSPGTDPELANDHNRPITGYITDSDLKAVVDAWPDLSQEAKHAIANILESEKKKS